VGDRPLKQCTICPAKAQRTISQPTLLHNRGIHVFDRVTKDDALRSRPSSLKSLQKDRFQLHFGDPLSASRDCDSVTFLATIAFNLWWKGSHPTVLVLYFVLREWSCSA